MAAESDGVVGTLVKLDNVPLERLRTAEDTVLGEVLRRFLSAGEQHPDEAAPRFNNFV